MNKLYIILPFLFASCMTVDKALIKINKAELTQEQKKLAVSIYESKFPPRNEIVMGEEKVDDILYEKTYNDLKKQLANASNDVLRLIDRMNTKEQDNDVLRDMLFDSKRIEDSLRITKAVYKQIPCPGKMRVDTFYNNNSPDLQRERLIVDAQRVELAKKDVEIAALKKDNEIKTQQINNNRKDKLKVGGIMFGLGIFFSIVAGLFLKLKKLI